MSVAAAVSVIPAAKAVGPHGRVIGADLAERLLVMAQAKADAQKLTNARFVKQTWKIWAIRMICPMP